MANVLTPDICVIGAGPGGLPVAAAAAAFGAPVVLVQMGKTGGAGWNHGRVAAQAMRAAANLAAQTRRASRFGLGASRVEIDFAKVNAHVHGVIAAIAPNDTKERFSGLGVQMVEGTAHFRDATTVTVGDAFEIKARCFVIATGSSAAIPPIPGLAETPYFTSETIFELKRCPEHLVVIGAGSTGLELAQAHRRLGAKVTVLETATPLPNDDPECAAIVIERLASEGIAIRAGVTVTHVSHNDGKIHVVIQSSQGEETVEASDLLMASGRRPNIECLELEKGGIKYQAGGIVVDWGLKTSNKRVYAIGDAAGGDSTHADYHAGIVIQNVLFRARAKASDEAVPRVTFTSPGLAHIGLTEAQARERHKIIRVLRWPYQENDRAQAERDTVGHIKVTTAKNGLILGATIVGAHAGELINTWTLALSRGLNIKAMTEIAMPYPTLSQIGQRAALSYFSPSLNNPKAGRLVSFLRRFG